MNLSQITPEQITATLTGFAAVVGAWKIARKVERKSIFNGSNGDDYERRTDSITKAEHLQFKKEREDVETKMEKSISQNRTETREDLIRLDGKVDKIGEEGRNGRDKIFLRLESDRTEIVKRLDKLNGGR